ncbi:MAG: hypothetical protein AAB944_01685 [Patescibacteria group bacterium]
MSIKEIQEKINPAAVNSGMLPKTQAQFFAKIYYRAKAFLLSREEGTHTLFMALMLIFVGTSAFGLGRLSMVSKQGPSIEYTSQLASPTVVTEKGVVEKTAPSGTVVASKKGSKYHFPWCSGAKSIAEENKITFNSPEEARAAGYTPAANCKGLE